MASKTLRERAAELGMKAMGKLFEDPKRAEAIAPPSGTPARQAGAGRGAGQGAARRGTGDAR